MLLSESLNWFYLSMIGIKSNQTITWYRVKLTPLLNYSDKDLTTITLNDLRQYRADLVQRTTVYNQHPNKPPIDRPLSPFTIHAHIRAAKHFFRWCVDEGFIDASPAQRLEKPKLPRPKPRGISAKARDAMLSAAAQTSTRNYALLLFFADTACRLSGACDLQWKDVDLIEGTATITEKGKKSRLVFLGKLTTDAIKQLAVSHSSGFVFRSARCPGRLSPAAAYQVFRTTAHKAGIKTNWNPHAWRHAAIRAMLRNGADLATVSQIAGHSSVQVTGDIYGVIPETALQAAHTRYNWLDPLIRDS